MFLLNIFFYYSVHSFCLLVLSTAYLYGSWSGYQILIYKSVKCEASRNYSNTGTCYICIFTVNLHVTYKNGNSEANTFHVFTCKQRHETHETKHTTIQV